MLLAPVPSLSTMLPTPATPQALGDHVSLPALKPQVSYKRKFLGSRFREEKEKQTNKRISKQTNYYFFSNQLWSTSSRLYCSEQLCCLSQLMICMLWVSDLVRWFVEPSLGSGPLSSEGIDSPIGGRSLCLLGPMASLHEELGQFLS